MAVICESLSVIIRIDRIKDEFGSIENFISSVPINQTFCHDKDLIRVGFMTPDYIRDFIDQLAIHGLKFLDNGSAVDVVVVDMMRGPTTPCQWVECQKLHLGNNRFVTAAKLVGSDEEQLFTPLDWSYDQYAMFEAGYLSVDEANENLELIETKDGIDICQHRKTGGFYYITSRKN